MLVLGLDVAGVVNITDTSTDRTTSRSGTMLLK